MDSAQRSAAAPSAAAGESPRACACADTWSACAAPNGAPYWFNPITNVSTYVRPAAIPPPPPPGFAVAPAPAPALHYLPPTALTPAPTPALKREKKDKKEKPKLKTPLGESHWIRVVTNKGNVFYNNSKTKESVWTVPDEVKDLVDRLEKKEQEDEAEARKKHAEEQQKLQEQERASEAPFQRKKRKAGQGDSEGEEEAGDLSRGDADAEEEEDDDDREEERGDLDIEIEIAAGDGQGEAVPEGPPVRAGPDADAEAGAPPAKRAKLSPAPGVDGAAQSAQEDQARGRRLEPELEQGDATTVTTTTKPVTTTTEEEEGKNQQKKKKKQKPKVVSSLEDLADEDWQRQIAEEMAREAEAEAGGELEPEPAATAGQAGPEPQVAPAQPVPHQHQQQQLELDQIEAAALFRVRSVSSSSPLRPIPHRVLLTCVVPCRAAPADACSASQAECET